MPKRILVLGGDGMLGHKMFQVLRHRFPQTECTIRGSTTDQRHSRIDIFQKGNVVEGVDAMDLDGVDRLLSERQPDVVVNCIGVIKQRSDAHASIPSITINALLPHRLAKRCATLGGRLIHFSTDCVFSGKRGRYTEVDASDAEDLYGKSKFLGEVEVENTLTLRTSIIGRELYQFQSLLEWFLSQNHARVSGYTRAYYAGVTTNHLADVVAELIDTRPRLAGLYQVAGQSISKHDLLCLIRDTFRLDLTVTASDTYFCDRSMMGDKFKNDTGYVSPSWQELLAQLACDPTPYQDWR